MKKRLISFLLVFAMVLSMFPGDSQAVLYFKDTKLRRGARCAIDTRMLQELKNVLGEGNVVVK